MCPIILCIFLTLEVSVRCDEIYQRTAVRAREVAVSLARSARPWRLLDTPPLMPTFNCLAPLSKREASVLILGPDVDADCEPWQAGSPLPKALQRLHTQSWPTI